MKNATLISCIILGTAICIAVGFKEIDRSTFTISIIMIACTMNIIYNLKER